MRFFRIAWFTPVLMSYVVVGIVWVWMYNYDWGAVNALLRWLGLGSLVQAWIGDPKIALPSLIFVTTWMWAGFNMVVLLAALHSLPSEVIEAAELDNCGWGAKLWHIIIPLVRPTLLNLLVLSFIGKMKIFDLVWITTQGGPLWSTERSRPTSTSAPSSGPASTWATPRPSPRCGSCSCWRPCSRSRGSSASATGSSTEMVSAGFLCSSWSPCTRYSPPGRSSG